MIPLLPVLTGVWIWANLVFASWRVYHLARATGQRVDPLKDWAVQLFLRGTALLCLIVAVVSAQ
jgi:hypothetical protein